MLMASCSAGLTGNIFAERPLSKHVLWRHDIDFSPQRALALAKTEASFGAVATYFVSPRLRFYNLFEPGIAAVIAQIVALGHTLGPHFDSEAYAVDHGPRKIWKEL